MHLLNILRSWLDVSAPAWLMCDCRKTITNHEPLGERQIHADNQDHTTGAVDQEAFETAIRENLSPESVVAVIALLQVGSSARPASTEGTKRCAGSNGWPIHYWRWSASTNSIDWSTTWDCKPKRPAERRGGWFVSPEDGSLTIEPNCEEMHDGEEDHEASPGHEGDQGRAEEEGDQARGLETGCQEEGWWRNQREEDQRAGRRRAGAGGIERTAQHQADDRGDGNEGVLTSPGGKTPHATLYAAILREITVKGKDARFQKTERGHFILAK